MKMVKIALLVPSRERLDKKTKLVESIKSTVSDINNVKLYFGVDDDDPTLKDVIELSRSNPFIHIVNIHNNGKFMGVGKLWNICANSAKEEILAMIGDDMVFVTKGWDEMIIDEFSGDKIPGDNLKMVYCYDGRHGEKIAANLFIHRKYMELNGYLMREEFMVDFIDVWIQQVMESLGRLTYRGDIHIEHEHWSFRKSQKDHVSGKLRGNNYPQISQELWVRLVEQRVKEAKKLGEAIGVEPDLLKINDRIVG